MKKKLFLVGILGMVLVFGFLFSGCASTQTSTQSIVGPDAFVGTWENSTGGIVQTLVFNADGSGTYNATGFTYKVDGNTADITSNNGGLRLRPELTKNGLIMAGLTFKKK